MQDNPNYWEDQRYEALASRDDYEDYLWTLQDYAERKDGK